MVATAFIPRFFVPAQFDDGIGDLAVSRQDARAFAIVGPIRAADAVKRVCHRSVASWLSRASPKCALPTDRLDRAAEHKPTGVAKPLPR
jgi:hypothetical protein